MKELYMASSAAARQSAEQQKLVLQMAEKASNGKELLLAMRAAVGVFPEGQGMEARVRAIAAAKMMHVATLNQMIEYAMHYAVNREDGRPFAQRMFQLAERTRDAQTWYRIELAARHLKVDDLEREAQGKGNQLAGVR